MSLMKTVVSTLLIWTLSAGATSLDINDQAVGSFGQISTNALESSATNCTVYDENFYTNWEKLKDAIREREIVSVINILKKGICIRCTISGEEMAALHFAARYKSVMIIKTLISFGADVHCNENSMSRTPLHYATRYCNLPVARELLSSGASVNEKDKDGYTPLHMACSWCDTDGLIRELVARGALIDPVNEAGRTPLFESVRADPIIFDTLLELGANVNFTGPSGMNILHEAAYWSYSDKVLELVKRKACLDCQELNGWTALHFAAMKGDMQSTQHLIRGGASLNIRDYLGLTPLTIARKEGHQDLAYYIASQGGEE